MSAPRILLVDDEQHIVDVVVYLLEEQGFDVRVAMDGDAGLRMFETGAPDLVILDLMLPGISGLDLFRSMRRLRPDAPVIMLTSRGEEIDRVLGLELGADDYVTKPFSTRELAARVKTVLRRTAARPYDPAEALTFGPLEVCPESFAVSYCGTPLTLTRAEFRFVEALVRYPARAFTRDELVTRLYDGEHVVTDRSIDAYVKRLRRKFAEVRPDLNPVTTVHGIGYKLNQELDAD
jgi:DNA-binding response OmpR family regulator